MNMGMRAVFLTEGMSYRYFLCVLRNLALLCVPMALKSLSDR